MPLTGRSASLKWPNSVLVLGKYIGLEWFSVFDRSTYVQVDPRLFRRSEGDALEPFRGTPRIGLAERTGSSVWVVPASADAGHESRVARGSEHVTSATPCRYARAYSRGRSEVG